MAFKKLFQGRNAGALAVEGRYYRPELDVVRFLAFLLVYLDHTLPRTGTYPRVAHSLKFFAPVIDASSEACGFGLSLFFALSAFLICELLLRERETSGTVRVKQFYIRRILRIWPLYYLGLALGVAVALLPGGQPADVARIGWFVIFMGAWQITIHGLVQNPMNPLWSISVEEQFYIFVPWVVKYFSRISLYGLCAFIIFVANASLYYLGRVQAFSYSIWFNSFVQFECFAAGILLCLVLRGRLPRIVMWKRLILISASWFCWFYANYGLLSHFDNAAENPGSWPLMGAYALAATGSVLILVAFLGVNPKLLPGWAIYLGRISFGLYVYHSFAIYIINRLLIDQLTKTNIQNDLLRDCLKIGLSLVLPISLTILMASLSYRYFETPFLKMKKRHAVIESEPVGAHIDL
jgi:peptidoglycan/LPS O-acetylase OafA/YrhL